MSLRRFVWAYVKSMRLYYAFITGIAGWIGVSFYGFCMPEHVDLVRNGLILVMLFLSWGINQIVNDYLGTHLSGSASAASTTTSAFLRTGSMLRTARW